MKKRTWILKICVLFLKNTFLYINAFPKKCAVFFAWILFHETRVYFTPN